MDIQYVGVHDPHPLSEAGRIWAKISWCLTMFMLPSVFTRIINHTTAQKHQSSTIIYSGYQVLFLVGSTYLLLNMPNDVHGWKVWLWSHLMTTQYKFQFFFVPMMLGEVQVLYFTGCSQERLLFCNPSKECVVTEVGSNLKLDLESTNYGVFFTSIKNSFPLLIGPILGKQLKE